MPRNRMVKPDFFDDEKLAKNTKRDTRLAYIGMWVFADDYGAVKGDAEWLKSKIFPYEKIKTTDMEKWIKELEQLGCIIPYSYNHERYYFMPNFTKHQTINKPSKQRNPEPPKEIIDSLPPDYGSSNVPLPSELKLIEVNGSELKRSELKDDIPYSEIIEDLNKKADKKYRDKTESYRRAIRGRWEEGSRLKDFQYVHTVKCAEWLGTDMEKYLSPDTLYRASKFDKYLNQKESTKPKDIGSILDDIESGV